MKVSVIVSICDNRFDMSVRSLDTWVKQTADKKDFEIVIIDDAERNEYKELCSKYHNEHGLQFQYIRIDNSLCDKPIVTFIPILSNNVGMRLAKGEVVVITGPETLQSEKNVEVASTMASRKECGYGLCYKSNAIFVKYLDENWGKLAYTTGSFAKLLQCRGAAVDCLTRPPHPPAYWYIMAVAKKYVEAIGGVDEEFAAGFCAEDDDFSNRVRLSGVQPVFEHKIVGIHQDHTTQDLTTDGHDLRRTPEGNRLRQRNISLMRRNLQQNKIVANADHRWGDEKVVIEHDIWSI